MYIWGAMFFWFLVFWLKNAVRCWPVKNVLRRAGKNDEMAMESERIINIPQNKGRIYE